MPSAFHCIDRAARALVFAGMTELGNVGGSAVRATLGRTPPLTSGHTPHSGSARRRVRPLQWLRHDLRLAVRTLAANRMTSAVLSYLVAQRKREIGLRLALGAQPESIRRLILGNGLALTGIGLGIGVVAALALVRVMRTLLYEVASSDPLAVASVICVVTAVAALASWLPARRVMRVDPVALLRED